MIFFLIFLVLLRPSSAQDLSSAPGFKLQDLDQDIISLSAYAKKQPVVILFWTTWCPMCPSELKDLNNAYLQLAKDGIEILAINSGELPDEVNSFVKSYYLAFRVLLDKDTSVTQSYGVQGFPLYVLINRDGEIVFKDTYLPIEKYKALLLNEE